MKYVTGPRTLAVLFACCFFSCSAPKVEFEKVRPKYDFEIVSLDQQAINAIMATPTAFPVEYAEDSYAWGRARAFFDRYVAGGPKQVKLPAERLIISNYNPSVGNYIYRVERKVAPAGYRYIVSCRAKNPANRGNAIRNARNFARFIRDGKLELSFLDK